MFDTMKASLLLFLGAYAAAAASSTAGYRLSSNGQYLVVSKVACKTAKADVQTRNSGLGCRRPAGAESHLPVDLG